jgi:hypothetical protein
VHVTTLIRLEGFEADQVRGQSGTIQAVVQALEKRGVVITENAITFTKKR